MPKMTTPAPHSANDNEKPIVLGRGGDGRQVEITLGELKSTLIGGLSGSGKSTLLQHIVNQAKEQAQVIVLDMKRIGYFDFMDDPNVIVITDINKVPKMLQKITQELENRFREMEHERKDVCDKGRIVVVADELGEIMPNIDDNTYNQIRRILSLGRAANITFIGATQSPTRRLLSGALVDLFPSRIALRCNSVYASRVVLDRAGAERLPNYSALFVNPQGFQVQISLLPPVGSKVVDVDKPKDKIEWDD